MDENAREGQAGALAGWPGVAGSLFGENEALLAFLRGTARPHVAAVRALPEGARDPQLARALEGDVERLWAVYLHYLLKEDLLLPYLADHGATDPHVEEEADDEARTCLDMARSLVAGATGHPTASNLASAADQVEDACAAVGRVAKAENEALLPLAVGTLGTAEWRAIEAGRSLYPSEPQPGAPLWPSPVGRMEAAVRHAIETGRLPGARP